jgi:hypothetical protein
VKDSFSKPSRKIITLAVIAGLFITALVVNKFWRSGEASALQNIGYSTTAGVTGDIAATDLNENGTPDWREMLLSSTEGDTASSTDNGPKTLTESVARDLFATTVYLTQNGQNELAEGDQNAVIDGLIGKLQNAFVYKQYTADGLQVDQVETRESIRTYATAVAAYQVNLILEMQESASSLQRDIGLLGDIYASQAEYLYAIRVPSPLAETHLKIVNNFSRSAAAFAAFKREKEDPILVPLALRTYQDASTEQELYLRQLAQYFRDNGILFSQDEIGAYWDAFATAQ